MYARHNKVNTGNVSFHILNVLGFTLKMDYRGVKDIVAIMRKTMRPSYSKPLKLFRGVLGKLLPTKRKRTDHVLCDRNGVHEKTTRKRLHYDAIVKTGLSVNYHICHTSSD